MEYPVVTIHKVEETSAKSNPIASTRNLRATPATTSIMVYSMTVPLRTSGTIEPTIASFTKPARNDHPSRTLGCFRESNIGTTTIIDVRIASNGFMDVTDSIYALFCFLINFAGFRTRLVKSSVAHASVRVKYSSTN